MASNGQSPSKCDASFSPSKRLVAIVNPQRRPQSEKKVLMHVGEITDHQFDMGSISNLSLCFSTSML